MLVSREHPFAQKNRIVPRVRRLEGVVRIRIPLVVAGGLTEAERTSRTLRAANLPNRTRVPFSCFKRCRTEVSFLTVSFCLSRAVASINRLKACPLSCRFESAIILHPHRCANLGWNQT